ncbi:DUF4044 domain-containing protein [Clostridium sp. BJN0001]|nr:DUF4044 domain-containing protein [Clostridium sp. BJN0001]
MKKKTRTNMTVALAIFMVIIFVIGFLPSLIF